jgi:hypothetical protein
MPLKSSVRVLVLIAVPNLERMALELKRNMIFSQYSQSGLTVMEEFILRIFSHTLKYYGVGLEPAGA